MVERCAYDKGQVVEEPCEVKVSCTVLKTNGFGDKFVEFNPGFNFFPLRAWAGIIFNPAFIFAIALSFVIQIIQSATIRNAAFNAKTNVTGISPRTVGLIAIASWSFDLIQTFSSRNPLQFSDPGDIFKCLVYNLFSIVAAELGYVVYRMLKG